MSDLPDIGPRPPLRDDPSAGALVDRQDLDLAAVLVTLSRLSADRTGLTDLLTQVATLAAAAIPGAKGAGLTLLDPGGESVVVASTEFVRQLDDIQHSLGQGPGISAATAGRTERSGSLGADDRWRRFGPRAGRLGVHSVLSLPLSTPDRIVGALNVYAHARDAFDARAEEVGEQFAVPAAISVLNAQILGQSRRLAAQLQAALDTRPVIDQAIGILRSRGGWTATEAFDRLRLLSQRRHTKLADLAQTVVDEAVAQARARRR